MTAGLSDLGESPYPEAMGSDGRRSGPRPQSEPTCEHCGRPVGTAIKRRKVLGAYVPVWGPAPCRNPECDACVADEPDQKSRPGRGHKSKYKRGHLSRRDPGPGPKVAPDDPKVDPEDLKGAPETGPTIDLPSGAEVDPKAASKPRDTGA
ncbi:hypothetical protein GCM10012286_01950 [Streptomyces lasiicapitis]|uniref:Uncharacterized protein n=2 Tax=Streptomyces lasiicapitis TaxID=1923961 RepID=A0ABQ2LHU8_9ACTN|nr:hypothetical protein GCM10012286_01950 [Streptomyces lasiicapitis]